MSRGGANLSDILPNYILKEQQELSCTIIATSDPNGHPTTECSKDVGCSCTMNTGIEYPKCPKGYLQSLVLIPQRFGGAHDYSAHLISSYYVGAAKNANTTLSLSSGTVRNPGRILEYADVFQLALSFTDCKKNGSATNNAWCPKATYYGIYNHDNGDSDRTSMLRENETINVLAQTYCVFDPTQIDWNSDGTVAGTDSSPTKTRPMDDTICGRIKTEDVCVNMGCRWDDGACTGIAPSP